MASGGDKMGKKDPKPVDKKYLNNLRDKDKDKGPKGPKKGPGGGPPPRPDSGGAAKPIPKEKPKKPIVLKNADSKMRRAK